MTDDLEKAKETVRALIVVIETKILFWNFYLRSVAFGEFCPNYISFVKLPIFYQNVIRIHNIFLCLTAYIFLHTEFFRITYRFMFKLYATFTSTDIIEITLKTNNALIIIRLFVWNNLHGRFIIVSDILTTRLIIH